MVTGEVPGLAPLPALKVTEPVSPWAGETIREVTPAGSDTISVTGLLSPAARFTVTVTAGAVPFAGRVAEALDRVMVRG
jgi:hypothetical protein